MTENNGLYIAHSLGYLYDIYPRNSYYIQDGQPFRLITHYFGEITEKPKFKFTKPENSVKLL